MVCVVSAHKREHDVSAFSVFICASVHISHDEGRFMREIVNTKARGTMHRAGEGYKQRSAVNIKLTSQMMYGICEKIIHVHTKPYFDFLTFSFNKCHCC